MFGWFKKKRAYSAADAQRARFGSHFAVAEGRYIQRGCIAAAMTEIDDDLILKQLPHLPAEKQGIYVMTYACYVMWALKRGLEDALTPSEIEEVIVAMERHFAKNTWYQSDVFKRIWGQMKVVMPRATQENGDAAHTRCGPFPLAKIVYSQRPAANLAASLKQLIGGVRVRLRCGKSFLGDRHDGRQVRVR